VRREKKYLETFYLKKFFDDYIKQSDKFRFRTCLVKEIYNDPRYISYLSNWENGTRPIPKKEINHIGKQLDLSFQQYEAFKIAISSDAAERQYIKDLPKIITTLLRQLDRLACHTKRANICMTRKRTIAKLIEAIRLLKEDMSDYRY